MAYLNDGPWTLIAGEDIARNRLVMISAGTLVYCDAGDEPVGLVIEAAAEDDLATVHPLRGGLYPITAAGVVAIGAAIYPADDGKIDDTAVGQQIGQAVEAATADTAIITCACQGNGRAADPLSSASGAIRWIDDFISGCTEDGHKFSETADKADWLLTLVDDGGDNGEVCIVADDAPGGWLTITTNDAASDSNELQHNGESFKLATGKKLWFETRILVDDVDKADWFVGLAITDTTVMAGATDRVGFECLHDGNIDALVEQDTTQSLTDTTSDIADGTLATMSTKAVTLAFYWDGAGSVYFSVDGVLKVTKTDNAGAIVIPDDEAMTPTICVETSAAQVVTAWVDYVEIIAERA